MPMLTMGEIQFRLRREKNLAEVGRALKVTRSYLSELARGTKLNPSSKLQERLSEYLTRGEPHKGGEPWN